QQLASHVGGFIGPIPAYDAAPTVEIGGDTDMVHADQLDRVVDVVDEIGDGRRGPTAFDGRERLRIGGEPVRIDEVGIIVVDKAEFGTEVSQGGLPLGRLYFDEIVERDDLHDATGGSQSPQGLVVEVAWMVRQSSNARMGCDNGSPRQRDCFECGGLGDVRNVDERSEEHTSEL